MVSKKQIAVFSNSIYPRQFAMVLMNRSESGVSLPDSKQLCCVRASSYVWSCPSIWCVGFHVSFPHGHPRDIGTTNVPCFGHEKTNTKFVWKLRHLFQFCRTVPESEMRWTTKAWTVAYPDNFIWILHRVISPHLQPLDTLFWTSSANFFVDLVSAEREGNVHFQETNFLEKDKFWWRPQSR